MTPPACQVHHPYTDTGTLHPDDLADLHRSGLSDGTIAAMGCRSVNQREIKKLTGVKVATGGYLLPYRDVLDQTGRPYSRVRLRNASKDLRYISGVGDDPQVYVPPGLDALKGSGILLITEGEKKSAKAVQQGIACIAIQGVFSGYNSSQRAQEKLCGQPLTEQTPPDPKLLEIARRYRLVVVLGDSDLLGNPQAKSGIEVLAKSLRHRGIEAIATYCPPPVELQNGELTTSKRGLDDWLVSDNFNVNRSLPALAFAAQVTREGSTDTLNAKMVAEVSDNQLVFSRGEWHVWDEVLWSISRAGQHRRFARKVSDRYRSFAEILAGLKRKVTGPFGKKNFPEDVAAWADPIALAVHEADKAARRIDSLCGMDAAFTLAQPLLLKPDNIWDRDPSLLGVHNGVVDLNTGLLRQAKPEDYVTRMAGAEYDSGALCPRFEQFLAQVQPQIEMRDFQQTLIGYAATGHACEQKIFIFHGSGANGKSLFMNLISDALGTYASTASSGVLALQEPDRPRNDLAALAGTRLLSLSETSSHFQVDENCLKKLTGNDFITARHLYKEYFSFRPEFTPVLDTNHLPRFRETGDAMTRRIRVVPWAVTIPVHERNPRLREQLISEIPGILAWVVRGAVRYLRAGLLEPEGIKKASQWHMSACDPLGRWIEERTTAAERTRTRDVYADYKHWATAKGELCMASEKEFAQKLKNRGWTSLKSCGNMMWVGVGLRDPVPLDNCAASDPGPELAAFPASNDVMVAIDPEPKRLALTPGGSCIA